MMTQFTEIRGSRFFLRLLRSVVLDQPTVDSGGVSRERSEAVAVCTSMALQWHFHATSMALPWLKKTASIRIG